MSYGADFAAADPAGAPLDPPLFIGADPFIWGAILLALAAALMIGWFIGQRNYGSKPDAADSIWKAIDNAAKDAMKADNNAIGSRAQDLRDVIERRLGSTLKLAGGIAGKLKPLDDALKGLGPVIPPGGAVVGGHGAQTTQTIHGPKANAGSDEGAAAAAAAAAAGNVTIVTVGHGPSTPPPHPTPPPTPPPPPPPPVRATLSAAERDDALRLAVAGFNQHWMSKTDRVAEMRAAYKELGNPGPVVPASGKVHGTHAGH